MEHKYIIKEVAAPDFSFYFDGDMFSKEAGNFGYTVFCITSDYYGYNHHYNSGINKNDFEIITREMEQIIEEVCDIAAGCGCYKNIKELMLDYGMKYNPRNAHILKGLTDVDYIEGLCSFLTVKTGRPWASRTARGYCQGDCVDVVYCEDFYTDHAIDIIGELYLGCGKEFSITFDKDDTFFGYFVADCEAWTDADYKKIVCGMEGINPDESIIEMIEGYSTITTPIYRTA